LDDSSCSHTSNTLGCDDGNACTSGDQCSGGMCLPGNPVSCEDGNSCTSEACDPKQGCVYAPAGYAANETEQKIPDSELDCGTPMESAVSIVSVDALGSVFTVSAEVELEHSWAGDLEIVLEHNGIKIKLLESPIDGAGTLSSNFGGVYVFADGGKPFEKLGDDVTIPAGTYAPAEPLYTFSSLPAQGAWSLTVSDRCKDDTGVLRAFRLNVTTKCLGASECDGVCNELACACQ
jgi:subtilisin-like proprotein convertase family protein